RPGLLSFFYVENETCTGTATPYIINIPALSFPHLPAPNDVRPQMHKSMTYRGYTGAAAPAVEHGAKEQDPYGYDVPGFEQGPFNDSPPAGSQPPPPYSPVSGQLPQQPQDAKGSLPARTDGTYSSSYEHTAAWVQGGGSQTTGSDTGGPSQKPLSAHQQAVYTPVQQVQPVQQAPHPQQTQQIQQAQQYSQPQQYSQAPVQQPQQQYVQAGYSAVQTQLPYSQPVVQTQQQEVPQSSSSHPTPQPAQQQQPPQQQQH
ncbi:hypothetical protein IWW56_006440, partial [Coemansia sp. RSA 2131]